MPDQPPIPDDEWLFDNVPDEQLFDAVVWEYCRTQEWIINAVKSAPIKSSRPMQKEAAEDVEFGSLEVFCRQMTARDLRRKRASISEKENTACADNEAEISVVEILARTVNPSKTVNLFIAHNLQIILGPGFPEQPYLQGPPKVAFLKHIDAMQLDGILDLQHNTICVREEKISLPDHFAHTKNFSKMVRYVTEKNGLPIEIARNEDGWRKFALAIDFSRTNEDLQLEFGKFLKTAREEYKIPSLRKSTRLQRGMPWWNTWRHNMDALNSLGAHRLIEAFQGEQTAAYRYATNRRNAKKLAPAYRSAKEMKRAAAKVDAVISRMFGCQSFKTAERS